MSALDEALKALNKKFGKGYVGLAAEVLDTEYKRYSTGVFPLDWCIGGGVPERKKIMIAGTFSSGKTTTALVMAASVQRAGGLVAVLDAEHGFDGIWATKLGVDVPNLIYAQPNTIEQMSDTAETLIMTGAIDLLIIDSIISPPSQKELEDSADQKSMGGKAKSIGLLVSKVTARLNDIRNPVKTSILWLNQIRSNVGGWGAPEFTPGGKQLHFETDIIIWLRPDSVPIGGKDNPQGITVKFKCTKNRTAPPFRTGTYDLLSEGRIDDMSSTFDLALALGVVTKVGQKFTFGDKTVTYRKNFVEQMTDDELEEIKRQILSSKQTVKQNDTEEDVSEVFKEELEKVLFKKDSEDLLDSITVSE